MAKGRKSALTLRMKYTPLIRGRVISATLLSLAGIGLLIVGFLLFLNSLGSGGGYFAAVLMISGVLLIVTAIVRGIIKLVRLRS
jgi:hypothetical protein